MCFICFPSLCPCFCLFFSRRQRLVFVLARVSIAEDSSNPCTLIPLKRLLVEALHDNAVGLAGNKERTFRNTQSRRDKGRETK